MGTVLTRAGAVVTLADVNEAELDRVVTKLRAEQLDVYAAVLDVSDWAAIESTISDVKTQYDRLDIVIANAGISGSHGPLTEEGRLANLDPALWQR